MVKNKKQAAQVVKALKEGLNENLNENENVDEIFGFGEPATDAPDLSSTSILSF